MAINYQTIQKTNPLKPSDPKKFYASAVYKDKMNLRRIAKDIARSTSLSSTDALAVLDALTQVIPIFLLDGNIVSLGDFGTFRITLHSTGTLTEEEFTTANITDYKLHFRAGKEFTDQLLAIEAVKV
jgi:predicted histone-like DNA-binding protein